MKGTRKGRGTGGPKTNFCYSGLVRALLRGKVHVLQLRTTCSHRQIQPMQPLHLSASPVIRQARKQGGREEGKQASSMYIGFSSNPLSRSPLLSSTLPHLVCTCTSSLLLLLLSL